MAHHPQGFIGPRSPQTEPVDFSGPPRPLGFGLVGPPIGPYSRESTPDSGGSHYIENYRDPSGIPLCPLIISVILFKFHLDFIKTGYSPHPGYGMMVQSDYPPNGYPSYAPTAYQCGGPYGAAVGPGSYPTPVSGGYSPSATSCYTMPPPQHIPPHEKSLKDG